MKARSIMVLGTSSHVGKSLLTAALCRIFARHGYRVAPFKSQNMSLNSAATIEGLEIGRAQALQAEAAGIAPSVDMNPILLKPAGERASQIIVRGKIWGKLTASDYHQRRVQELLPIVRESYEALAAKNDIVVIEGAGSPAEINLKQNDIVNMRIAEMADASCLLVGDIDRGGVFASLLGTVELLERDEQERIRGFVINKFRGDVSLLEPGIRMMEQRLLKPCLGVVPYLQNLTLDEEDSLGLPDQGEQKSQQWQLSTAVDRQLRIAVVALPSFSNFTDFDALRSEPSVSLRFCKAVAQLQYADIIILPGSKQTVDDLIWLRSEGIERALMDHALHGLIVGICGGMQMLGESIVDPEGMEHQGAIRGLGLLPIRTTMQPMKVTNISAGELIAPALFGQSVTPMTLSGYEIHIGETSYLGEAEPLAELSRQDESQPTRIRDGCITKDGRVFGTYLHGLFDEDSFRHLFIDAARSFHRLAPALTRENWKQKREDALNRLADSVEESLDMEKIFGWLGVEYQSRLQTRSQEALR
ncbi:adenosylcobyric acid synthase [Silvibacterium bohemicum]|uniref:Cobyric acid synthase n=1 Tax=Silvibacterium bohemicum TaxID=1577686 RepID=A0A841JR82_9BACT|nr:cobyric acid synthase [Silvibacterium bohemicum]MBB6142925.1 adenosylcobyric acid synthase [Silvibacterium bohemicum]